TSKALGIIGGGRAGTAGATALDAPDYPATPLYPNEIVGEGDPATACWKERAEGERGAFVGRDPLRALMGPSRQIENVRRQVALVASSPLTALIQGETGTGKELVARGIHYQSVRCRRPFIALDCGAIPEPLIESEL